MEIGSFIDLQLPKGLEYYNQKEDIIRLNTGRAALWHAFRCTGAKVIWLPVYQCESVHKSLGVKGVQIKRYHIDREYNPIDLNATEDEAVLFVNYFGIMSHSRMMQLSSLSEHPIIDNCQSFFCDPIEGAMNVYSCRKFVGVPDGAYVIGKGASQFTEEYKQGYSSDTAGFLLNRIEYGCEGKSYAARCINEHRIDMEDIMKMSKLTHYILDGTEYEFIKERRRENFAIAHVLFGDVNKLDVQKYYDKETIPMVYPLLVEDDDLIKRMQAGKHFQGHWWSYIFNEQPADSIESWISRYVIPITIDQRYGREELVYLRSLV